jgi:hypothetical protein
MPSLPNSLIDLSAIHIMKKLSLAARYAIYFAALSTEATATFTFLPSWNERMTTIPYALLCHEFSCICKFLGSIKYHQNNFNMRRYPSGTTFKRSWDIRKAEPPYTMPSIKTG